MNLGDSSLALSESDSIRAVSEMIPESPIRNLMLKCMLDAERDSAGGAFVTLSMIADGKLLEISQGNRFDLDILQRGLSRITDDLTARIVMDAIRLSGRRGKIMLDTTNVQKTEITYGTQACRWSPDVSFFTSIGQSKASVQNCKVVFVDGIIESVSECHKLFHESYERKIPIAIFARGYSEEVVATAAVNFQRQTAQIIPIVVPFDEVGVNGMADIAGCFNSEVVSSDKGQLISTINIEDFNSAELISCTVSSTEIEFKDNRVEDIVRKLSKRLDSSNEDQADLIRRRISALGSGIVTIKIGADRKSEVGIRRDRIDFGLRYVRLCMLSGTCEYDGIALPQISVKRGSESAKSFISILESCGEILEVDKCG